MFFNRTFQNTIKQFTRLMTTQSETNIAKLEKQLLDVKVRIPKPRNVIEIIPPAERSARLWNQSWQQDKDNPSLIYRETVKGKIFTIVFDPENPVVSVINTLAFPKIMGIDLSSHNYFAANNIKRNQLDKLIRLLPLNNRITEICLIRDRPDVYPGALSDVQASTERNIILSNAFLYDKHGPVEPQKCNEKKSITGVINTFLWAYQENVQQYYIVKGYSIVLKSMIDLTQHLQALPAEKEENLQKILTQYTRDFSLRMLPVSSEEKKLIQESLLFEFMPSEDKQEAGRTRKIIHDFCSCIPEVEPSPSFTP